MTTQTSLSTRELISAYRALDPAERPAFLREHAYDVRFVSLVLLGNEFIQGLEEHLRQESSKPGIMEAASDSCA